MRRSYLILAAFLLSLSPPLVALTAVPSNYIFVVFCCVYLLSAERSNWQSTPLLFVLLIIISSLMATALAGNLQYIKYPVYICLALLIIAKTSINEFNEISSLLDNIVCIGLVLSVISVILYAIWPMAPIYTVINPDGRESGLYYFAYTNFALPSVIRPAFIFDEPGTFSFIICMSAIFRDILGKSKFKTALILLSGLITFSLTQFIIVILFLLLNRKFRYIKILTILLILLSFIIYLVPMANDFFDFFVSRLVYDTETGIGGDNRSNQVSFFFEILDNNLFFFGMPECFDGLNMCSDIPDLGSNPFTPISAFGFLIAWPFYLMLSLLLIISLRKKFQFSALAIILLLLQRPFLFSFGYSVLILLSVSPILFWRIGNIYFPLSTDDAIENAA